MNFTIETAQEADGRWIAQVPEMPGVLAYGDTENDAKANAEALAIRVLAEQEEFRRNCTYSREDIYFDHD